jgi:hypothetical protein
MRISNLNGRLKHRRFISLVGGLLALMLLAWVVAAPATAGPGKPPSPGGQGSIAVMVVEFDLGLLLSDGLLNGTFAVQNKDPLKNPDIIVPDDSTAPGNFVIQMEQRVGKDWVTVAAGDCSFDPTSLILDDEFFQPVAFECLAGPIDEDAKSVRVTAIVPLDGRLFLSRLSQKIF